MAKGYIDHELHGMAIAETCDWGKSVDKLELTAIIVAGATAAAVVAVIVFHISTA